MENKQRSHKKSSIFIAIVFVQIAVIGLIGGMLWHRSVNGTEVTLQITPVDPRDPLRGDYVTFSYEDLSRVTNSSGEDIKENTIVYVSLKQSGAYWIAQDVNTKRPAKETVFLQGVVERVNTSGELSVRYGIEEYFIEEGVGQTFRFWDKEATADVRIGSNGKGTITKIYIDGQQWP